MSYPVTFLGKALQIPENVPHPDNNTPIDFSDPADWIIYIVLPIVAAILVLLWMRKKKQDKTK
ncbi:adenylosuccinate synthetase [Altibacter sp. HG106]|uniref:adenylosuccinate synthetase n=1 Tax=Altibacter sp. HG106 TaxID=3023937 RepID=UPI002350384D|nr:adenylosuccinate synthetase [Altibacter sp. HG106]MDC7993560.1 adenylosuccinate synthetase [Altibacter sp. HG106]